MKKYLVGFYFSLPVQLLLLHFRKYQGLLVFWFILFSTVNGTFLKTYGANSLYLAPEYLGKVNALSACMVGISAGIFIMSWNITAFILHSKHIKFLATTANPFLKFCINNGVIPLLFLLFYLVKAINFNKYQQLLPASQIFILIAGFTLGLLLSITVAFLYFFGADKTIYRRVATLINTANKQYDIVSKENPLPREKGIIRVDWFLSGRLELRKPRDVRHYSTDFLDSIFKRNHFAAVISIVIAIVFLLTLGFFMDYPLFQLPAGASSTLFFSVLIAVVGAVSLFLKNWSLLFLLLLYLTTNWLYQNKVFDNRNKAYGLNYQATDLRPLYSRENIKAVACDSNAMADKREFINILENWKKNQQSDKPVIYFISVSGGGNRSSTFTLNVLQHLDSVMHGELMKKAFLINGASGGMLGAAYFRELYLRKLQGEKIDLYNNEYVDNISKDLLNPLFSSFVARDITSPAQTFSDGEYSYVKDRGYAFELKLNNNTQGVLNRRLSDYIMPEQEGIIPLMFFNSIITRDARRMLISAHPARFMMKPALDSATLVQTDPDLIDYITFFKDLNPHNLRLLSALRMNATFPYVLPTVWLPAYPPIDVMDAGIRDNYGMETTMRFIQNFKGWLTANTSNIVIIQIRDRVMGEWVAPEKTTLLSWLTKPMVLLQGNLFELQDYYQADELSYLADVPTKNVQRVVFQYVPAKQDATATLSFHLTNSEKIDIANAIKNPTNTSAFNRILELNK